jgi:uncharacterized protein (DUF305 family)
MHVNHYARLGAMVILSFLAMYALMYSMVDEFASVYSNLNQVYMAGLMAMSMVPIEIGLMWSMYKNRTANIAIVGLSIILLAVFFIMIRQQSAIGDNQFLRSMIPHHSGAILMCREASISDAEIKKLCSEIIENQRSEISQMKTLLEKRPR